MRDGTPLITTGAVSIFCAPPLGEGHFPDFASVPKEALTITCPGYFMRLPGSAAYLISARRKQFEVP